MSSIDIDFTVQCGSCGADMENNTDVVKDYYGKIVITIRACNNCMQENFDKGHDQGYEEAQR